MENQHNYRIVAVIHGKTIDYHGTETGTRAEAIAMCNQVMASTPYRSVVHAWIVSPVMVPAEPWVTVGPHMPSDNSPLLTCRVCESRMSGVPLEIALNNLQQGVCSDACRSTEQKRHFACCDLATPKACVCAYAFECAVHGETHVGTHD